MRILPESKADRVGVSILAAFVGAVACVSYLTSDVGSKKHSSLCVAGSAPPELLFSSNFPYPHQAGTTALRGSAELEAVIISKNSITEVCGTLNDTYTVTLTTPTSS